MYKVGLAKKRTRTPYMMQASW